MKQSTLLALLGASLAAVVTAKPHELAHQRLHHRRQEEPVVTETVYENVTETVDVYVTVVGYPPKNAQVPVNANKPAPAPAVQSSSQPAPPPVQGKLAKVGPPAPTQAAVVPQQAEVKAAPVNPPPAPVQPPQQPPQQPSTPQPAASPKAQPATGGSSSGPSGGACGDVGGKCTASDVTIYNDQGTGACGWSNDTNSEDFFALASGTFGSYSNDAPGPHKNAFCGRTAMISAGGQQIPATLTDSCPGCTGWSIDLSQALWNKVFPGQANTRIHDIEWWFTGPEIYHGPGN